MLALPEASRDQAQALAEQLRAAVETERFAVPTSATPIGVTMSLGIALFPGDAAGSAQLIHAADSAVYQAKADGRNRIVYAADLSSTLLDGAFTRSRRGDDSVAGNGAHTDTNVPLDQLGAGPNTLIHGSPRSSHRANGKEVSTAFPQP